MYVVKIQQDENKLRNAPKKVVYSLYGQRIGDKIVSELPLRQYHTKNPNDYVIILNDSIGQAKKLRSEEIFGHVVDEVWNVFYPEENEQLHAKFCPENNIEFINFGNLFVYMNQQRRYGEYPRLFLHHQYQVWWNYLKRLLNIPENKFLITLHMFNVSPGRDSEYEATRILEYENYVKMLNMLFKERTDVVIVRIGTPVDCVQPIYHENLFDLTMMGIEPLYSATVINNSSLYIGGDTGPTHMAAALQVPTVATSYLWGETREDIPGWCTYPYINEYNRRVLLKSRTSSEKGVYVNGELVKGELYRDDTPAEDVVGAIVSLLEQNKHSVVCEDCHMDNYFDDQNQVVKCVRCDREYKQIYSLQRT